MKNDCKGSENEVRRVGLDSGYGSLESKLHESEKAPQVANRTGGRLSKEYLGGDHPKKRRDDKSGADRLGVQGLLKEHTPNQNLVRRGKKPGAFKK